MQIICNIPALFGNYNSHAKLIHTADMTTNNPFLTF